jgi:hypothetical protein
MKTVIIFPLIDEIIKYAHQVGRILNQGGYAFAIIESDDLFHKKINHPIRMFGDDGIYMILGSKERDNQTIYLSLFPNGGQGRTISLNEMCATLDADHPHATSPPGDFLAISEHGTQWLPFLVVINRDIDI